MIDISKYRSLLDAGYDKIAIYRALRSDGFNEIDGIGMLREVFGLSLVDAKRLAYEADTGESIEKLQPDMENGITDVLDDFFGEDK